jgi:hypothetical protein
MARKTNSRIRLGDRDLAILRFIGEQRTSWLDAIHGRFYDDRSIEAARSTMRRLCGRAPNYRFVRIDQLDGNRNFFRLTARGAKIIGATKGATAPLGRTALLRRYALQWYLEVDGKESRWHCNPRDYPDLFPIKGQRLPRANFFLEETPDGTMLGFAIEDYGSDTRRVSRRSVDLLERFLEQHWFDELFAAQRFGVTFLVATPEKATAIEHQFQRDSRRRLATLLRQIPSNTTATILTDYVVVPGLLSLLPTSSAVTNERISKHDNS